MSKKAHLFQKFLRPEQIVTDMNRIRPFNVDWTQIYHGNSELLLLPKNTSEVSQIISLCNNLKLPIITIGGATSLVAGATPANDEIIVSTEKMNHFSFDKNSGILSCEAGTILQLAQEIIFKDGFETPYNLGSKGTCTVGGNVSTCAGGINFVKYGSLSHYVAGLEVVLASGEILDLMNSMPKNNTGMDLKQLFIASEGTLGIITKVKLVCPKFLPVKKMLFLKIAGFENVPNITQISKNIFGKNLCAIEYIDGRTFHIVSKHSTFIDPFSDGDLKASKNKFHYLIIEIDGNSEEDVMKLLEKFTEFSENSGVEILFYESASKMKELWEFRESIVMHLMPEGKLLKYDLSIPPEHFKTLLDSVESTFAGKIKEVCNYGHIGDANVHLQVILEGKEVDMAFKKQIDHLIYLKTIELGGSISAEHGIGQIKRDYLKLMKGDVAYQCLRSLKNTFDPNHILNPGKIIKE